ncbi:MAG: AAA family ATPase [Caldilineaceae bacterium]|nr:AAA family ATPase [Caldilineaceae bacterium]
MITSVRLVNFKNFADETLRVGPFTVIVGANASGKSNIRDAFRFLHGIGRGYTLAEIIGGKYGGGGQSDWTGIRGAMDEIIRFNQTSFLLQVEVEDFTYTIRISRDEDRDGVFQVAGESLKHSANQIYSTQSSPGEIRFLPPDNSQLSLFTTEGSSQRSDLNCIEVGTDRPGLTQILWERALLTEHRSFVRRVTSIFSRMRFLDLVPSRMREPAFPGQTVLGDGGEHLPTVLRAICEDSQRKETLVEWISELTPMDVHDFEFPIDPSGRVHLGLIEANGRKVSAYAASDGTLRFLAMLATLLGPNPDGLYFFEEIDNGIHPARQWLLLELIEKQAAKQGIQVITTTHSPDLLTLMNDETFKNTSVVCRLEDADDAIIRPVSELPRAGELRKSQGLNNLLSGGWMEDALAFTEGYGEEVGK